MNHHQAKTLAMLMTAARPLKRYDDDPEPDIHLHTPISYTHGDNALEVRFFSTTGILCRFPDTFYIRVDGSTYWYDADTDTEVDFEPDDLRWTADSIRDSHVLVLTIKPKAVA